MANYTCPPQKASGAQTFSNNLVGLQLTDGGGLTLGNFISSNPVKEKTNRNFDTGSFSIPYTLKNLEISSIEEAQKIFDTNYKIYPNFDNTDILNFVSYGPLLKRFEASIRNIINFFPAAFEVNILRSDFTKGPTIKTITHKLGQGPNGADASLLEIDVSIIKNPFSIDYTTFAEQNIKSLDYSVSEYRNFTKKYKNYVVEVTGSTYQIFDIRPTTSLNKGTLNLYILGVDLPTGNNQQIDLLIRPNDFTTNKIFNLELDEVDEILLNRFSAPVYTATFKLPSESENGNIFIRNQTITFPLDGSWNLDIGSIQFVNYVEKLQSIAIDADNSVTNLVERFYTTDSLKEFDTDDQKISKTLKIYGRSFDDTKKYIDSISHTTSVNYNVKDDISSGLLPNLIETLGWKSNISPIQSNSFLSTIYQSFDSQFSGMSESFSLEELQNQYYRNLILNSAYIFNSKGTRKSVEFLMKFIGAPEALVEFNENVYLVDDKFPLSRFDELYLNLTGGTFTSRLPVLDPNNIFRAFGTFYTGVTSSTQTFDVSISRDDYPIDSEGYPKSPPDTESMFFQKGSGWFESTDSHMSPDIINRISSVFTGDSVSVQTMMEPFTYGQKYLNYFTNLPYFGTGFGLRKIIDNKKSWTEKQVGIRKNNDASFDSYYETTDDRLVLNVKNVDLFLNPGQAITYDVWYMSNTKNYPIPLTGLTNPYPQIGGLDWTFINPKPQIIDFFEFNQTFWKNMINVRDRQQNSDGKTGGYFTLQSLFWKYFTMYNDVTIENNNFNYQNMIEYINSIGDYWVKLVEQVIPATTLWNTGTKFENSIFHRQKFQYRPQRGCVLIESEIRGPQAGGGVLQNNCASTDVQLDLTYNENLILSALNNTLNQFESCSNTDIPYIQKLKYSFSITINKGGTNINASYTEINFTTNPNLVKTLNEWNSFLTNGFNNINFDNFGISVSGTIPTKIFESQDCEQIEVIEFNLSFVDVTINCL